MADAMAGAAGDTMRGGIPAQEPLSGFEIALIGLAGRFPGASNVDEFWQNLRNGVESITFFSKEQLAPHVEAATLHDPDYVRANGVLDGVEWFDASFFGYPPRQAEMMDPQQRLFLECAWEALENAGYASASSPAPIGVYAGVTMNSYLLNNLIGTPEFLDPSSGLLTKLGNDKDFLATRVAYKLNLAGPAVTVQTACSTSLVAVHLACQALLGGDCEIALAGGVSICVPQEAGYHYQKDGIVSPDGHCRPFDARAQGTVGGNAVGIVALKRLADALEDGDEIRAVIKGSAINNDGADKVGFTAPSVEGQAAVISRAHALAGIDPASIGYVEAHGTATALGDPIEVAALRQAFRAAASQPAPCAIGSLKSNIGHVDAAAGVASLIKVTLALQHGELPPSLHFETPNPKLELENGPFYVNAELAPWPERPGPRRAGVSSFGIGGTNAHVAVEQAPPPRREPSTRPWHLLMWSARTAAALDAASQGLADHLAQHPDVELADVGHTLQVGRKPFKHRRMAVWRDTREAAGALSDGGFAALASGEAEPGDRPVLFMFPGQGAQHPNMARDLYRDERIFREQLDQCCDLLRAPLELDLREVLFPHPSELEASSERLRQTRLAQPALFAIEYALAKLWIAWGVQPRSMIGHSIGEYVAACLSEVFSLEQGLALVATRGRLMQGLPPGCMLAVALPAEQIEPWLGEELDLAGVNEPAGCVVSGHATAIEQLERALKEREISSQRLRTSHAFHSRMMDDIVEPFTAEVARVDLSPPRIPFLSNLTGHWISADEATDPARWARQLREPVQFSAGIQQALGEPDRILLEVGPGTTLTTLARRHAKRQPRPRIFSSLPHAAATSTRGATSPGTTSRGTTSDTAFLLGTLGQLWLSGIPVNESPLYADERRRRIPLPSYPFERQRYWIDAQHDSQRDTGAGPPRRVAGRLPDLSDWFYLPTWRGTPSGSNAAARATGEASSSWLVFVDRMGIGHAVAARLRERGHAVTTVSADAEFTQVAEDAYSIEPESAEHYVELLGRLHRNGRFPDSILHAFAVTGDGEQSASLPSNSSSSSGSASSSNGVFHSLIELARALGREDLSAPLEIVVLSNGVHQIAEEGASAPAKATLLGPCRVIPKEYPQLACRNVDIALPSSGSSRERRLLDQLMQELLTGRSDPVVAYRGDHRFTQSFEPTRLAPAQSPMPVLRERGVYLITGGLGGIGLAVAELFAKTARARLILVGRSAFPARRDFGSWLAEHPADDPVSQRIHRIEALEAAGAEVTAVCADVCDAAVMGAVVNEVRQQHGAIHGVVHAAGLPDGKLIQRRTHPDLEAVLAPKVAGTLVLDELLRDEPLDFFVLCSSLASTLGPAGQVAYVAANAFLDAFACSRGAASGAPTISINWDTWREVGMAVAASRQLAQPRALRDEPSASEAEAPFDRRIELARDEVIFARDMCTDSHWELGEHRIGGTSLLPGTGFVELAAAALRQHTGAEGALFHELLFLQPLRVGADEKREVRTLLTSRDGEGRFEVSIRSRRADTDDPWLEHARGELSAIREARPRTLDLAALKTRAAGWIDSREHAESAHVVEVGARWACLASESFEQREGIATLELPSAFASDLADHPLHPALLDVATSFIVRHFRGDDTYLPYGYKGLRVAQPLPAAIVSHMRCLEADGGTTDTLRFRITIMDREGNELVSVDEYILRRVDVAAFAAPEEPEPEAAADLLRDGMSSAEGLEVFERILASGHSRVLVSTLDLEARAARSDALRAEGLFGAQSEPDEPSARHPRPSLSTPYVAASCDIERKLIAIWESLLGIDQIGIHDDFLELGGDSLLATQVTARIRNELETELPIGALFDDPTVAGLARRAEALRGAAPGADANSESSEGSAVGALDREELEL